MELIKRKAFSVWPAVQRDHQEAYHCKRNEKKKRQFSRAELCSQTSMCAFTSQMFVIRSLLHRLNCLCPGGYVTGCIFTLLKVLVEVLVSAKLKHSTWWARRKRIHDWRGPLNMTCSYIILHQFWVGAHFQPQMLVNRFAFPSTIFLIKGRKHMKGGGKSKVVCSPASVRQVEGYIFQMESSISVHRHSTRHRERKKERKKKVYVS